MDPLSAFLMIMSFLFLSFLRAIRWRWLRLFLVLCGFNLVASILQEGETVSEWHTQQVQATSTKEEVLFEADEGW